MLRGSSALEIAHAPDLSMTFKRHMWNHIRLLRADHSWHHCRLRHYQIHHQISMAKKAAAASQHDTQPEDGTSDFIDGQQEETKISIGKAGLTVKGKKKRLEVDPSNVRRSERSRTQVNYAKPLPRYTLHDPKTSREGRTLRKRKARTARAARTATSPSIPASNLQQSFSVTGTSVQESKGATEVTVTSVQPISGNQEYDKGSQGDGSSALSFGNTSAASKGPRLRNSDIVPST
jgi:hypothetical protein